MDCRGGEEGRQKVSARLPIASLARMMLIIFQARSYRITSSDNGLLCAPT